MCTKNLLVPLLWERTWTLQPSGYGLYGILSYITHRHLSTHQILLKSEKLCGRMDVWTDIETGFIWSTPPNQPKYTCLCPTRSLQITTSMKSFKDLLIFQYSTYSTETTTELVSLQILCTELLPISTKIQYFCKQLVLKRYCVSDNVHCLHQNHKSTHQMHYSNLFSCQYCQQLQSAKESSTNKMFVMLFWVPWIQQPCLSISCHLSFSGDRVKFLSFNINDRRCCQLSTIF